MRVSRAALTVGVTVAVCTACGGGGDSASPAASAPASPSAAPTSPAPSSSAPSSPAPSSSAPTTTDPLPTDEPTDTSTPSSQPSAPQAKPPTDRQGLTRPGSRLAFPASAIVRYESGDKATLQVTPKRVKRGTLADFEGYRLDATAKASTPFYVTMSYRNVGRTSLKYPYLNVKLDALDANGDQAQKLFVSGLGACRGDEKPSFYRPGDTVTECAVFLLPKGGSLKTLSYRANFTQRPVTWSVTSSKPGTSA